MKNENLNLQYLQEQIHRLESQMNGSKDVLNLNEVATFTGYSKSYLYKLTMSGLIPHYKPNGKAIFFSKKELESWLLSNPKKQAETLESEAATYVTTHQGNGGLNR